MTPATATDPVPADEDDRTVTSAADEAADDLVVADMLVEEISIDGMCGVY